MNPQLVKSVFDATEHSWEATSAQWMTVFDAVTKTPDRSLAPIEQAVWNTYTQARDLRKLVSELWQVAQVDSRPVAEPPQRVDVGAADDWIVE
jgi:hypothetical protein